MRGDESLLRRSADVEDEKRFPGFKADPRVRRRRAGFIKNADGEIGGLERTLQPVAVKVETVGWGGEDEFGDGPGRERSQKYRF